MKDLFDGSDTAIEFIGAGTEFLESLSTTFLDEEIVQESSFTGTEILTIIGNWTASFAGKLAKFLTDKKKIEAAREIRIKIGENEFELIGFGGEDIETMKESLNDLVKQLREV